MNLFRRDTLGTVDNYTSLVRPQIDQNALNPQFRRDIHRLDHNTSQLQGTMQQQLTCKIARCRAWLRRSST